MRVIAGSIVHMLVIPATNLAWRHGSMYYPNSQHHSPALVECYMSHFNICNAFCLHSIFVSSLLMLVTLGPLFKWCKSFRFSWQLIRCW